MGTDLKSYYEDHESLPAELRQSHNYMAAFLSEHPSLELMKDIGRYMLSDECEDNIDLEPVHSFSDGIYVRELTIPAGVLLISKKHKVAHPTFLMRGRITVITESGEETVTGPVGWTDKAGIQRAIYAWETATIVTVHRTDHTDLELIEDELIIKEDTI